MLNLKSFEAFVNELKPHKRLNENENPNVAIEPQSEGEFKLPEKYLVKSVLS